MKVHFYLSTGFHAVTFKLASVFWNELSNQFFGLPNTNACIAKWHKLRWSRHVRKSWKNARKSYILLKIHKLLKPIVPATCGWNYCLFEAVNLTICVTPSVGVWSAWLTLVINADEFFWSKPCVHILWFICSSLTSIRKRFVVCRYLHIIVWWC